MAEDGDLQFQMSSLTSKKVQPRKDNKSDRYVSYRPNQILVLKSDTSSDREKVKPHYTAPVTKKKRKIKHKKKKDESSILKNVETGTQPNPEVTKKSVSQQPSVFNYFLFQQYLQLQSEIQRRVRLTNLAAGIPTVGLEYFSDEVLQKEFTDIYGPFELYSHEGGNLYEIFRKGRLKEITTWLDDEKIFRGDLSSLISYVNLHRVEDIVTLLIEHVTNDKFHFYDQNPYTNDHNCEWFIIPRPRHSNKKPNLREENDSEDPDSAIFDFKNRSPTWEIDLRKFDPKFEMPDSVLQDDKGTPHFVPRVIRQKLFKMINNFNIGIQLIQVVDQWLDTEKYFLELSQFGVGTFSELVSILPDVFFARPMGSSVDLVFPSYLNGQMCEVNVLYRRIWQRLIFLVHHCGGRLPVNDNLNKLMKEYFQIDIIGYSDSIFFFLNDIYLKLSLMDEKIYFDTSSFDHPYLKIKPPSVNKSPIKVPTKKVPQIPDAFVQAGDVTKWVSEFIYEDTHSLCISSYTTSLNSFYVSPLTFWDARSLFMGKLQVSYKTHKRLKEATVHPECLVEGLIVAVFYTEKNKPKQGQEYHRAKILGVPTTRKSRTYTVHLIDFGEKAKVDIENIKYLFKEFLRFFPAVAIECEVHLSDVYKPFRENKIVWELDEIKKFQEALAEKTLCVHFICDSKEKPISQSGKKWVVSISVVDPEHTSTIITSHVERKIITKYQERYLENIPRVTDGE